ncbi:MAG: Fe-S cluster assembly scaffold protein NifU [Patescibacteria group bacterium]|nr:Fe-S cluster assembly scaffold protein NifU [Patescibacteria group bacterium]
MAYYSDKIMDHFRKPRNFGEMKEADGVGEVGNKACGDVMKLFIKVKDNVITEASFMTFGCAAAIATSSILTEMIKGKTLDEALKISNQAVAEQAGGLPPQKIHCSVLAEQALRAAIEDYQKKKNKNFS